MRARGRRTAGPGTPAGHSSGSGIEMSSSIHSCTLPSPAGQHAARRHRAARRRERLPRALGAAGLELSASDLDRIENAVRVLKEADALEGGDRLGPVGGRSWAAARRDRRRPPGVLPRDRSRLVADPAGARARSVRTPDILVPA